MIMRLARRIAALLAGFAVLAGGLAVASPASAATDTPRPGMSVASSINVIDLSDAGTYASMESAKNKNFPKGKVYRNGSWDPPHALEPLTAYTEFIACDFLGSQVWTVVINPNDVRAPFDFVVDPAIGEGVRGTEYASPGWNILMTFNSPGAYHFAVGWDDQNITFAENDLVLTCPSPPDPEWPPTN